MSGLTIGIGSRRYKYAHRSIRERLLRSAGVGICPGLSNRCKFGLYNNQDGSYAPATELELIMFCPLPFGDILWHLITQVNGSNIAA